MPFTRTCNASRRKATNHALPSVPGDSRRRRPSLSGIALALPAPDHRLDGVFGVAPLFLINSVSRSTALSIGRPSATSIGVLPRPSLLVERCAFIGQKLDDLADFRLGGVLH